jgi:DNA-binding NtrC family response regulator
MRILIVEDEEIERVSLQDDLRDAGHETLAVESPLPALELLKNEPFELVITDLKMPQMDGLQFLQEIKSRYPQLDVIVMTAYGMVKTAVKAMKFGGTSVQDAPSIERVTEIIRRRLDLQPAVVISAMGKTTRNLLTASSFSAAGKSSEALAKLDEIRRYHQKKRVAFKLQSSYIKGMRSMNFLK